MRVVFLLSACCCLGVVASSGTSSRLTSEDRAKGDFYYTYFKTATTAPAQREFYNERPYSDYSQHFTRTEKVQRGSSASQLASGPYFSYDSKDPGYTDQNYDYDSSDYGYSESFHEPAHEPSYQQQQIRRPPQSKKPIKRVSVITYLRHKLKQRNSAYYNNQIDNKNGDFSTQGSFPDSFVGFMSVVAGVAWFLVSKSATPVVKMRSGDDTEEPQDIIPAALQWPDWKFSSFLLEMEGLYKKENAWNEHCQKRAFCEVVQLYPQLANVARFTERSLKLSFVQKLMGIRDGSVLERSEIKSLFQAAYNGENGLNCTTTYSSCEVSMRRLFDLYRV